MVLWLLFDDAFPSVLPGGGEGTKKERTYHLDRDGSAFWVSESASRYTTVISFFFLFSCNGAGYKPVSGTRSMY